MTDAVGPVFVAGCPRSGTTALSWAIAAHPGYHTSAETHFFYYLLRESEDNSLQRVYGRSSVGVSWLNKWDVSFEAFLSYIGLGLDRMIRDKVGGLQWIDGSPENVVVGDALLTMFPSAHMFVAVRDPRAVCLSMLNSGFAQPWARDIAAAIFEWKYYAEAALRLVAVRPERALVVRQEDMRRRSAAVAAAIAERLRLKAPERVANYLSTRTINSSFDKRTYAPHSPYRTAKTNVTAEEFLALYGERIVAETGELARQFGYFAEDDGGVDAGASQPAGAEG